MGAEWDQDNSWKYVWVTVKYEMHWAGDTIAWAWSWKLLPKVRDIIYEISRGPSSKII